MESMYLGNIAHLYCAYLQQLVKKNYHTESLYSIFSSSHISLQPPYPFLCSLIEKAKCSLEVFVISLMYLERVEQSSPGLLNMASMASLAFTSLIVAMKYHEDHRYDLSFFASISSMSTSDLCCMETDLLNRLHFSLFISSQHYNDFYNRLIQYSKSLNLGINLPELVSQKNEIQPLLCYTDPAFTISKKMIYPVMAVSIPVIVMNVPMIPVSSYMGMTVHFPVCPNTSTNSVTQCSISGLHSPVTSKNCVSSDYPMSRNWCYPYCFSISQPVPCCLPQYSSIVGNHPIPIPYQYYPSFA